MSLLRVFAAELRKTATLPAGLVALVVASCGCLGITLLNAVGVRDAVRAGATETVGYTSAVEAAFSAVPLGTIGAVIIGVVTVSSEYTTNSPDAGGGRQVTATLISTPRRWTVLAAKALATTLLVAATAAVLVPACVAVAHLVTGQSAGPDGLGEIAARCAGTALYWVLTALIASGLTVLTRSGVVPLVVLIANSSVVSVPILLTDVTPLAYYLPDVAGMRLFAGDGDLWSMTEDALGPVAGGLVMAAWALGLLAVAGAVLARRDA